MPRGDRRGDDGPMYTCTVRLITVLKQLLKWARGDCVIDRELMCTKIRLSRTDKNSGKVSLIELVLTCGAVAKNAVYKACLMAAAVESAEYRISYASAQSTSHG